MIHGFVPLALLMLFSLVFKLIWIFWMVLNIAKVNISRNSWTEQLSIIVGASSKHRPPRKPTHINQQDPDLSREQRSYWCVFVGRSDKRLAFQLMSCIEHTRSGYCTSVKEDGATILKYTNKYLRFLSLFSSTMNTAHLQRRPCGE